MVTATIPRWSLLPGRGAAEPELAGLSCKFSRISCCCPRMGTLATSSSLHDVVVGVSWRRGGHVTMGRRHSNASSWSTRAILAEPAASEVADKDRTEHGATRMWPSAVPGTTSLPTTQQPEMGLVDSSLESTLEHRLWVAFGASATVGVVAKGVLAAHSLTDEAGVCLGAVAAYILADLGTGIYHWGIDNYGDASTPIFGPQIDAFQGHHKRPWTIAKREFANNVHIIARSVGFVLLPFVVLPSNPAGDAFLGLFLGLVIMSQQFHAWAHSRKSHLPRIVSALQEKGVLISRKMHGTHHQAPYNINYCIVSGLWNPSLRKSKFFERLEAHIYAKWGVAPRSWADTVAAAWLQEGSYFEDGSDMEVDP